MLFRSNTLTQNFPLISKPLYIGTNKTKIEVSNLAISINALPVNFWSDLSWIGYIYIERERDTHKHFKLKIVVKVNNYKKLKVK